MFRKLQKGIVLPIPKAEHKHIVADLERRLAAKEEERQTIERSHNALDLQVIALYKEVDLLKEVNTDQLKRIEALDDTRAMQHMLLQKAVNLILEKANTSKERKARIAEVVDGARMLGIDVFSVVTQAIEAKENTDGNH